MAVFIKSWSIRCDWKQLFWGIDDNLFPVCQNEPRGREFRWKECNLFHLVLSVKLGAFFLVCFPSSLSEVSAMIFTHLKQSRRPEAGSPPEKLMEEGGVCSLSQLPRPRWLRIDRCVMSGGKSIAPGKELFCFCFCNFVLFCFVLSYWQVSKPQQGKRSLAQRYQGVLVRARGTAWILITYH